MKLIDLVRDVLAELAAERAARRARDHARLLEALERRNSYVVDGEWESPSFPDGHPEMATYVRGQQ